MLIRKLDTHEVLEVDDNEAIAMILADVAVEACMPEEPKPESAMLDHSSRQTATRPLPAPRPQKPPREKRRKK